MNFFADYNNLALIAVAVVSGGLLAADDLPGRGWQARQHDHCHADDQQAQCGGGGHPRSRGVRQGSPAAGQERAAERPAARAAGLAKDKSVPIIVVCQTGQSSGKAHAALKEAGYSEVYSLDGGLAAGSRPVFRW